MLLGFGEAMLRLVPPGFIRLGQVVPGSLDVTVGGAEANVCGSLASLGYRTRFLTALPRHTLADGVISSLRAMGVDTSFILRRDDGRLGLYFVEMGANHRGANVLYDRAGSAVALAAPEEYRFEAALEGVTRVHVTGITPALSERAFQSTLLLVRKAAAKRCMISCDINFRAKLWRWRQGVPAESLARECMSEILPFVDLVFANEEDAGKVLGIWAENADVDQGRIDAASYVHVVRRIHQRFSQTSLVAVTLRQSVSATHNNWGALLLDARTGQTHFAPLGRDGRYSPYEIRNIVDRLGAGDSFVAALVYALDTPRFARPAVAVQFATAASCLKHSIMGDVNRVTVEEIEALMTGSCAGRVQR